MDINIFCTKNFTVDHCLSGYTQKSDLESLTKSLKQYGQELQNHMTDILKNETEAIVNLAEYLTNLKSKIGNLSVPVSQLREEIRTLFDLINIAENWYQKTLQDVKANNNKTNQIHFKLEIFKCSLYAEGMIANIDNVSYEDILTLEHLVDKYSYQKTLLDELNLMSPEVQDAIKHVEIKLIDMINDIFLKEFRKADSDKETVLSCLRMYDNLRRYDVAHIIFQKYIVRPYLQQYLKKTYFEKCGYQLDIIYARVIDFLNKDIAFVERILKENPHLKLFNFVLNSFWEEFQKESCEGLPNITAPGNPELFQQRFSMTCKLLEIIGEKGGDKNMLKNNDSFQEYLKRFNLPVYFEIKYQQIASDFENGILSLNFNNIYEIDKHNEDDQYTFKMKPSTLLWSTTKECFNKHVYIDQLADQFIKLSMMLISRYVKFVDNMLRVNSSEEIKVDFIVRCLSDLCRLLQLLAPDFLGIDSTVYNIIHLSMRPVLKKLFDINKRFLDDTKTNLKNQLVEMKVKNSLLSLQNVASIPRLYRRTNRLPPKEASLYMVDAIKPILIFTEKYSALLVLIEGKQILDNIIENLTKEFLHLVDDVLSSVCKTEESLRRLKSRSINLNEEINSSTSDCSSDEKKIREQIKHDVHYFLDKLYPLGLQPAKKLMDSLKNKIC